MGEVGHEQGPGGWPRVEGLMSGNDGHAATLEVRAKQSVQQGQAVGIECVGRFIKQP